MWKIGPALVLLWLSFVPTDCGAVRYLDTRIGDQSLQLDGRCLELEQLQHFQVINSEMGLEATLKSEADLVDYFARLYACDIIKDRRIPYGRNPEIRLYMVAINNKKKGRRFPRTLLSLLNRRDDNPVYYSRPPRFFRSLEQALASREFRHLVQVYGPHKVFIEGINYTTGRYIGLFDADRRQLVVRN